MSNILILYCLLVDITFYTWHKNIVCGNVMIISFSTIKNEHVTRGTCMCQGIGRLIFSIYYFSNDINFVVTMYFDLPAIYIYIYIEGCS